jgi:hypothetical protein
MTADHHDGHGASMTLGVHLPLAGKFLCLEWYTDDERTHLVLAPSEPSLMAVVAALGKKEPWAEIRNLFELEMVAPPLRLVLLADEHRHANEVSAFRSMLSDRMFEVNKEGLPLPWPFSLCPRFEPQDEEAQGEPDAFTLERHWDCRHCVRTIQSALSDEELFARYAADWFAADLGSYHRTLDKLPSSRAEQAQDAEMLWYAKREFGPHASGIVLAEVKLPENIFDTQGWMTDDVLFFFRRGYARVAQCAAIKELFKNKQAAIKRAASARDKRDRDKRKADDAKRLGDSVAFFTARGGV